MSERTDGGISFLGLLTILFIGLKLGGVIDWAWYWVLGPLWIPVVAAVAMIAGAVLTIVLAAAAVFGFLFAVELVAERAERKR